MKYFPLLTAVVLAIFTQPLPAVTITGIQYETLPYTGQSLATAAEYASNWTALRSQYPAEPVGYGSTYIFEWSNISNQNLFGSGGNIAYHVVVSFFAPPADVGTWDFRFGIAFGLGGALFIDGVARDFRSSDMWWQGSYSDPLQILAASLNIGFGSHTIEIFGLEPCCDGVTEGQFRTPGGAYRNFVLDPLDEPVPDNATWMLTLAGLAAVLRYHSKHAHRVSPHSKRA